MCYFNKIQKLQKIEVKKLEQVQQIIFFLILSRVFWNCWCFTISSTNFNTNMLHRVAAALSDCLAGKGSGTRHVQERFPLPVCAFVPAVVNVRFMRTLCLVKTFFRFRFVFRLRLESVFSNNREAFIFALWSWECVMSQSPHKDICTSVCVCFLYHGLTRTPLNLTQSWPLQLYSLTATLIWTNTIKTIGHPLIITVTSQARVMFCPPIRKGS